MRINIPYMENGSNFDIDGYVCECFRIVFDREGGSRYWNQQLMKHPERFNGNPRRVDSLEMAKEVMRPQPEGILQPITKPDGSFSYNPPADLLLPKSFMKRREELRLSHSSGTTKLPKSILCPPERLKMSIDHCIDYFEKMGLERGKDILAIGPATLYKDWCHGVAEAWGGTCYFVSMPTVGIKDMLYNQNLTPEERAIRDFINNNVRAQSRTYLEHSVRNDSNINIDIVIGLHSNLVTIADIIAELGIELSSAQYVGVLPGLESFKELKVLFPNSTVTGFYTHYMKAIAPLDEKRASEDGVLDYTPTLPFVHSEVRDPNKGDVVDYGEWGKLRTGELVDYGESGRIRDLIISTSVIWDQWEDGATRGRPSSYYPEVDTVRNIGRYTPATA